MKTAYSLLIAILITATFTRCDLTGTDPKPVACLPPTNLTAQAPCESGYPGALLTVSGYEGTMPRQFIYTVFLQKDTLSNDISNLANKWGNASNERIIVPDAVVKDAPKFIVQVSINCDGKDRPSQYFAFVKRVAANPACYVWARQKL